MATSKKDNRTPKRKGEPLIKYYPLFSPTPKAQARLKKLEKYIKTIKDTPYTLATSPKDADYILVGGGDGFMLDTLKKYAHYEKPFFGVNCGTLGFLLNTVEDPAHIPMYHHAISSVAIHGIDVEIILNSGETEKALCFNDIIIGGNVVDYYTFSLSSKRHFPEASSKSTALSAIKGSGLVLSTAIGSTAYWLNLGGPLMPLRTPVRGVIGIATMPYHYTFFPQEKVCVAIEGRKPATVGVDGYGTLFHDAKKVTCKPSKHSVTLCFSSNTDFETKRLLIAEQKIAIVR